MKGVFKLMSDDSVIVTLYDGTRVKCDNIHNAILFLIRR